MSSASLNEEGPLDLPQAMPPANVQTTKPTTETNPNGQATAMPRDLRKVLERHTRYKPWEKSQALDELFSSCARFGDWVKSALVKLVRKDKSQSVRESAIRKLVQAVRESGIRDRIRDRPAINALLKVLGDTGETNHTRGLAAFALSSIATMNDSDVVAALTEWWKNQPDSPGDRKAFSDALARLRNATTLTGATKRLGGPVASSPPKRRKLDRRGAPEAPI